MVMHWRRVGGKGSGASLLVNAIGASATMAALAIIIVTKFLAGAWITLLLIPALLMLFRGVKRHYAYVTRQTQCPRSLDVRHLDAPLVVVPIEGWNTITEKALRFGMRLSPDVIAVHVTLEEEDAPEELKALWAQYVVEPLKKIGDPPPRLEILPSPYRRLFTPLFNYIAQLKV